SETRKLDVLVVDDDPDVRSPLCTYLQRSGLTVRGAGSGADGMVEAVNHAPDIVITDIAMPGMDGIEFCRRLKKELPELPVVLMSGQASAIDQSQVRDVGAAALLAKPFTMRQVLDLLGSIARSSDGQT